MSAIFLIERKHLVRASRYLNAPLVPEWRTVGRFEAGGVHEAILKAWVATHRAGDAPDDPESELRVAGITTPDLS